MSISLYAVELQSRAKPPKDPRATPQRLILHLCARDEKHARQRAALAYADQPMVLAVTFERACDADEIERMAARFAEEEKAHA